MDIRLRQKEVLLRIAAGVIECKHHAQFTKRVEKAIQKLLPEMTVSITGDEPIISTRYSIKVWGGDLSYDNRIELVWRGDAKKEHWYTGFVHACERFDSSDTIERERDEEGLYYRLSAMENYIHEWEQQIQATKIAALNLISSLPVPKKSATVRADKSHWTNPTEKTRAKFPRLFK